MAIYGYIGPVRALVVRVPSLGRTRGVLLRGGGGEASPSLKEAHTFCGRSSFVIANRQSVVAVVLYCIQYS